MGIWETRLCSVLNRAIQFRALLEQNDEAERKMLEESNAQLLAEEREITSALRKFSQSLPEANFSIQYITPWISNDKEWQLIINLGNGAMRTLEEFPAGYRRIYSIVLDIIYRSWILNRNVNPSGIVVIDEIDLHLHPALEQTIVSALRNTFPRIQFILTTHSPLVISNLPTENGENCIISMPENHTEPKYVKDAYRIPNPNGNDSC